MTDINSSRVMQPGGVFYDPAVNREPVLDQEGMTDAAVADEVTDEQIEEAALAAALVGEGEMIPDDEDEVAEPVILRKKAPAKK
jgi:hypothetical protein